MATALTALSSIASPHLLSEALVQELHENIDAVLQPLHLHSTSGRPSYSLDLDKAEELRYSGATWDDIAKYHNVARRTLYRHMAREGRLTRRPYDDVSDGDLDELVSGIVLHHPQSGAVIVLGHLATLRVKVPLVRVKDSLRRSGE